MQSGMTLAASLLLAASVASESAQLQLGDCTLSSSSTDSITSSCPLSEKGENGEQISLKAALALIEALNTSVSELRAAAKAPEPVVFYVSTPEESEQIASASTGTKITSLKPAAINYGGGWSHTDQQFTVPRSGLYSIKAVCSVYDSSNTASRFVKLYITSDGEETWAQHSQLLNTGELTDHLSIGIQTLAQLSQGQTLELAVRTNDVSVAILRCHFMVYLIGGGESPPAFSVRTLSSSQNVDLLTPISTFEEPSADPLSLSLGGGWSHADQRFVVPRAGLYSVTASCNFYALGTATSRYVKLGVTVDGADWLYTHSQLGNTADSDADYVSMNVAGLAEFFPGQALSVFSYSLTTLKLKACYFSGYRVGDGAAAPSAPPAFFVARGSSLSLSANTYTQIVGLGAPPIYGSALNIGGGWSNMRQAFSVPSPGIYSLSVVCDFYTYHPSTNRYISLYLYRDGAQWKSTLSNLDTTGSGQAEYVSINLHVYAELAAGQDISVYAYPRDNSVTMKSCWLMGRRLVGIEPRFIA